MQSNRFFSNNFLSVFSIISSIMVVGIHCYDLTGVSADSITSFVQGFFSHGLFCAAVPTFFLVSGYLFFYNADNISAVFNKQKKRFFTLVIPFLAWSIAYYGYNCFMYYVLKNSILTVGPSLNPLSIIKGVLLYEYCLPMWYMFELILFTAITPFVYLLMKKCKGVVFILPIICFVLSVLGYSAIGKIGGDLDRTVLNVNYLGYWLLGCALSQVKDSGILSKVCSRFSTVFLFIGLMVSSLISSLIFDGRILTIYNRIFIPVVTLFYILLLAKVFDNKVINKNISNIPTMIIYGIHQLLIIICSALLSILGIQLPRMLNYFVLLIGASVLSIISAIIIKKYMKPIYKIFGGNR